MQTQTFPLKLFCARVCTEERAELKAAAEEAKASLPKFACAHHAEFTVPTHLLGYVIGTYSEEY